MSQIPSAFTQAASQGYGDFSGINEEDEEEQTVEDEQIPDGPQSPEPSDDENENYGFTQTQERSYPQGIDSSENEEEQNRSSPPSPELEDQEEKPKKSSAQTRRVVQIANDSDSDDDAEKTETNRPQSSSNKTFLQQFVKSKDEDKKHKKRTNDEQNSEKNSKRSRRNSDENEENSDVDDVVDGIFGKDDDEGEKEEVEPEVEDFTDEKPQENEQIFENEEEVEQEETYTDDIKDEDDDEPPRSRKQFDAKPGGILEEIELILKRKSERRRMNRTPKSSRDSKQDLRSEVNLSRDLDKLVQHTIEKMRIAAEEDRIFNENRQPATAKLQLLPLLESQVFHADLTEIFLENGVLSALKDWLTPLPDKSLPNMKIRQSLIRILEQFNNVESDRLKESGIGKALMYLYKHPQETKENKIKLIKIIHDWSRQVFKLRTDHLGLSREEREKRDADQALFKRQASSSSKSKSRTTDVDMSFLSDRRSKDDEADDNCPRARVPRPSYKDYIVRPVSKVEAPREEAETKGKQSSRLDNLRRQQQDRKRQNRPTPIVKLSIEGNRMHI